MPIADFIRTYGGVGADMIGRTLRAVKLSDDKSRITFEFAEGPWRALGVEGDCCSTYWVEHLTVPDDLDGAKLLAIEDSGSEDVTDDREKNPISSYGSPEHECLQVYQTLFRCTDRGDIIPRIQELVERVLRRVSRRSRYGRITMEATKQDLIDKSTWGVTDLG